MSLASPRPGTATLSQVAQRAQVSTITASRALSKPHMVAAETVQRVKAAAQQLGYVPNLLAGGLKSRRSHLVTVLLPTIAGSPFLRMVQSLTDCLAAQGYQMMLGQIGYDHGNEDSLLDAVIGRRPDGIVVAGAIRSVAGRAKLQAAGIPVVETWELHDAPIDMSVGFSHAQVGAAVAQHLWQQGRRHFGIASADDVRGMERLHAFVRTVHDLAARAHTSVPEVVQFTMPAPSDVEHGRTALAQLLVANPQLDALYCNSDRLALGALAQAQALGLQVPAQLAIVGFGDVDFAAHTQPRLSTVRVHDVEMGRIAAEYVMTCAEGREPLAQQKVDVGFSITARETCGLAH